MHLEKENCELSSRLNTIKSFVLNSDKVQSYLKLWKLPFSHVIQHQIRLFQDRDTTAIRNITGNTNEDVVV